MSLSTLSALSGTNRFHAVIVSTKIRDKKISNRKGGKMMTMLKNDVTAALFLMIALAGIASAESGAAGKDIFTAKCAVCHGADGSGQTSIGKNLKVRDLHSPDVQKQSDADLKAVISKGKGRMPAFRGKLKEEQIEQLVSFIRELGSQK